MSNSLADILGSRKFDEPPEAAGIKDYVNRRYKSKVKVVVRPNDIVLTVSSAALAATLRMEVRQLQQAAQTDKKLLFRIG